MKVNTMIRSLKKTRYALLLLPFFQLSYANLTIETAKTIQGTPPRLSDELESSLINTGELKPLFGLIFNNRTYYNDEEIAQISIPINDAFSHLITPAMIKQPDANEYFDRDGDKLSFLTTVDDIEMQWYSTNPDGTDKPITFGEGETFCSLAARGESAPFKVKLSADLILFSEHGDPDFNTYPNDVIDNKPSATFTILKDVGVCYAKPSLKPNVPSSDKGQWTPKKGFKIQSSIDSTRNFPTTGFFGAQFDLILFDTNLYSDYQWYVKQGSDLVTVIKDTKTNIPTVMFNGPDAKDPGKAWEHVMGGSGKGYPVVIEGKNTKTGKTTQYAFTIRQWYDTWKQKIDNGKLEAVLGKVSDVVQACESKSGYYHVSRTEDISNAIETVTASGKPKDVKFTREIGTLISEWGDVDQKSYPGSFGPQHGGNPNKRFYVYSTDFDDGDPEDGKYCDIHLNDGTFHCREKEKEHKNAVCVSYRP